MCLIWVVVFVGVVVCCLGVVGLWVGGWCVEYECEFGDDCVYVGECEWFGLVVELYGVY